MNIIAIIFVISLLLWNFALYKKIEKEKKKNRVVQAFLAGVIRAISDYKSNTDKIYDAEELPEKPAEFPIPYSQLLENIDWEFSKDFLLEHYETWLKNDRAIFEDAKYSNDGFNFIYYDFFDRRVNAWNSKEQSSQKNIEAINARERA